MKKKNNGIFKIIIIVFICLFIYKTFDYSETNYNYNNNNYIEQHDVINNPNTLYILSSYENKSVEDDVKNNIYPLAANASEHNEVFVGRIRRDESVEHGLNIWVVADNIRKGAATNAIQIVKELINHEK